MYTCKNSHIFIEYKFAKNHFYYKSMSSKFISHQLPKLSMFTF